MTARSTLLFSLLLATAARAQLSFDGDLVLVRDTNGAITNLVGFDNMTILPSKQEQFCRAAFNAARANGLPDVFDGVFAFSAAETMTDLDNVWQGSPVRKDGTGYGRDDAPWKATYDSTVLGQCVYMGTLGRTASLFGGQGSEAIPPDPDSPWTPSLGIPIPGASSLTGIEMMGHEYGHHWLMGIEFDQADGRGRQSFIRGFNEGNPEGGQMGSPNQHYSHYADSRSVMYGECITDLGNGSFRIAGCPRKYSEIDQYLMGLRAPEDVTPMMVLEDPATPGQGVDSISLPSTAAGTTVSGLVRHDITAQEIAAAMGPRTPGYPAAKNCWRVAFLVVLAPGQTTVPQAMLDKVRRYQARWGPWFHAATDGRGTMETSLGAGGCFAIEDDAGVPMIEPDAGQPEPVDAGELTSDAGTTTPVPDAGEAAIDAGPAGEPDAGAMEPRPDIGVLRPGCGCGGGGALSLFAVGALLLRRRR